MKFRLGGLGKSKRPNIDTSKVTKASEASSGGMPNLSFDSIKAIAKPSLGKLSLGIGSMPAVLAAKTTGGRPDFKSGMPAMPALSAGASRMAAQQLQTYNNQAPQSKPVGDVSKPEATQASDNMVIAASTLAGAFSSAATTVQMSEGESSTFLAIASKIEKHIESIEAAMVDEQDTSIIHAASEPNAPTSIIQQPFMPTIVTTMPQEQSFFDKLLSLAGWLMPALSAGFSIVKDWMGSLWTTFNDHYLSQVKNILTLGWSKLVTGFDTVSGWVTSSIDTVVSWVDTAFSKVFGWAKGIADKISSLWSNFDFSKIDITRFNLSGLWERLQTLDFLGDIGQALKTMFGIFGGTGLETLKTVFSTVSKVWGFMKPIVSTIAKFAKFLGPVGFLFGLASQGDNIMALFGDVAAAVGADTAEDRTANIKKALSHAARIIAEMILPESWVDKFLNSKDEDSAIESAQKSKAIKATGNYFGADYEITDESELAKLDSKTLEDMANSGDFSDSDTEKLKKYAEQAKQRESETPELLEPETKKTPELDANASTLDYIPTLEPSKVEIETPSFEQSSKPETVQNAKPIKATEASTKYITPTPLAEPEIKVITYDSLSESERWAHDFYPTQFFGKSILHDLYPDAYRVKYGKEYNKIDVERAEEEEYSDARNTRTDTGQQGFEDGLETVSAQLVTDHGAGPVTHFYPDEYELVEKLVRGETKQIVTAMNVQTAMQTEAEMSRAPAIPIEFPQATSTTVAAMSMSSGGLSLPVAEPAIVPEPASNVDSSAPTQSKTEASPNLANGVEEQGKPADSGSTRSGLAANFATRKAYPKTTGYCARSVANGLQAAGYRFTRNLLAYQYSTNGTLRKMGFEQYDPRTTKVKAGDISVMGPRYRGHAGHMSIFNGKNWVSDFVQQNESPYRSVVSSQWITRWRDTGNTTLTPAELAKYNSAMSSSSPSGGGVVNSGVLNSSILAGLPSVFAEHLDTSKLSEVMSSLITSNVDGLAPRESVLKRAQNDKPSVKTETSNNTAKASLQLDELLMIPNGFD